MSEIRRNVVGLGWSVLARSSSVVFRTFSEAVRQALREKILTTPGIRVFQTKSLTSHDAHLILNADPDMSKEEVLSRFQKIYDMNDPSRGGSLYIQSRVYHAKEYILKSRGWDKL